MARWMSMMDTRGLLMCLRLRRLTRTVMFPHTEMTRRTLYVAMDRIWPSLNVMSMGKTATELLPPLLLAKGPTMASDGGLGPDIAEQFSPISFVHMLPATVRRKYASGLRS